MYSCNTPAEWRIFKEWSTVYHRFSCKSIQAGGGVLNRRSGCLCSFCCSSFALYYTATTCRLLKMFPRVSMLRSFGVLARRSVTTTASRQLSEGTAVSRDAKEFVRMLKTDRMLVPLILAFASVFGVAHYSVSLQSACVLLVVLQ